MKTPLPRAIHRCLVACFGCVSCLAIGCSTSSNNDDASATSDAGNGPLPMCEGTASAASCMACTHQGLVQGGTQDTMCEYLGIPYAQAPVGDLRFAAPRPADGWNGVRDSTAFGAACPQGGVNLAGTTDVSEDCLFINVWTPTAEPTEPLPVMVYIYGGGYTGGATNAYSGLDLARAGNVVVVSMNYRVGALGFFAHPDLDAERADAPSGSDGIRDQQLALQWVHDNVAAFHGDANNVTIFGESAGSSSVGVHLVSPGSRGLVQRFIMESGVSTRGVANGIQPKARDDAYARTAQMATDLCPGSTDVIGCLRGLPADQIMAWAPSSTTGGATGGLGWGPVIEGPGGVLPDSPDALMEAGDFNPGEIIVGTNKNEYALFQLGGATITTIDQMRTQVQASYPDSVDTIMALYAPSGTVDVNEAYVTMMTDVMFRCETRSFARLATSKGRSVYVYSFEQGTAMHSEELNYIFGPGFFTLGFVQPVPSLQDAMRGHWYHFAQNGDPNGEGLIAWPKYDATSDQNMTFVDPPAVGSGLQKDACDFWDGYLASH